MDGTVFYSESLHCWIARYPAGKFNTGKIIAGYGNSEDKAKANRDRALTRYFEGKQQRQTQTLRKILNRYIEWLEQSNRRQSTLTRKTDRLEQYLKPYMGLPITDIDESMCLKVIATAKANSRDSSNNKISATIWSEMHQLFTWCKERNIITQDPSLLITRPKYSSKAQQKNEINIDYRINMGKWLLNYTSQHIDAYSTEYGMILTASMGLRAGEIRGLEWKCFQHLLDRDFDETVLIVQQIYDRNLKTKQWELQEWTKSNAKGYRELAVPRAWCENFFNFYLYEQDHIFNEFHLPYDYQGYCFLNEQGKPFTKNQQQQRWSKLKDIYVAEHPKTAEIDKDMRIHDMRHVIASLLIENGATLEQVKPILGHMDKNTTDYYTHLSQKFSRETMNKIPNLLEHGDDFLGFFSAQMKLPTPMENAGSSTQVEPTQ